MGVDLIMALNSEPQVVCRILENASPLPAPQSADYLIMRANGSKEQVSLEHLVL